MLLRRFVTNERHKEAIMNATYTVLGDYLTPTIVHDEDLMSADYFRDDEVPAEAPAEAAPAPAAEPEEDDGPLVPIAPPAAGEPYADDIPEEEPDEVDALIVEYTEDDEPVSGNADPLDLFVDRIRDLGIDITEE
jgi:hypothetical protein